MTKTLRIEKLSYGRGAIARDEGMVIFVDGGAPGDLVQVEVSASKKRFARGRVIEVIEAGPSRTPPPCPIVTQCGGCPWQHINYPQQLLSKKESVIDTLERIGKISDPPVGEIIPSPKEFEYRNRLTLHARRQRLGYYQAESNEHIATTDCLLGEPVVQEALKPIQELLNSLATPIDEVTLTSRGTLEGVTASLTTTEGIQEKDLKRLEAVVQDETNSITGITLTTPDKELTYGDLRIQQEASNGSCSIESEGTSFGQVNSLGNHLLIEEVMKASGLTGKEEVLDLYAGSGNFSFPLAANAQQVLAVDVDATAIACGRRTVSRENLENLSFHEGSVLDFLQETREKDLKPDLVVVDPPRTGLAEVTEKIAKLGAAKIVYVSCNPATLARDSRVLVAAGYELRQVTPLDLFPQTFHVETVSVFELSS